MRIKNTLGLLAMLVFILPVTVNGAVTVEMFGSTGSANVCTGCAPGGLGRVDQTTGLYTFIGDPTASNTLSGIDFGPSGVLFGTENISGGAPSASSLITIDPTTGGLLSTVGSVTDIEGLGIKISDLAFQPGTGVLFAYSNLGDLFTINTATAVATLIGNPGLGSAGGGLAFTSSGSLFLARSDRDAAELDPATGAVVGISAVLPQCFDGLAARPTDDVVFGTECDGQRIYTIDVVAGTTTLVGDSGTFTTDLAFRSAGTPPAPFTSVPTLSARGVLLLLLLLMSTGIYLRRKI